MSFIKAQTTKYVYSLIKKKEGISRDDVASILFRNQVLHCIPIAPFYFSSSNDVESDIVRMVVDDLIERGIVVEKDKLLRVSKLDSPLEGFITELPTYERFEPRISDFSSTDEIKLDIGSKTYKVSFVASPQTRRLSRVIPPIAETGAIFSLPPDHLVFKTAIPLFSVDNGGNCFYFLAPSEKVELMPTTVEKNIRKIRSLAYQLLGPRFSEARLDDTLKTIFLSLLPLSSVSVEHICENNHVDPKSYDSFLKSFVSTPARCEDCFSRIVRTNYIVKNPKIFDDWKNGALNEWFVSSMFSKAGWPSTLWNFESEGYQYDGLAFDSKKVIVAESKRTFRAGTEYREGTSQLRERKEKLLECELPIKTVLFTLVRGETPPEEKGIDVIITAKDYNSFVDKPNCFL
jgi:hypothetical protein